MKRILIIVLALVALCACSAKYETPVLSVDGGKIVGVALENGVALYKGIPYAAPPVGENRWRKPQSVENWDGVRVCDTWGPASLQGDKVPGSFYVKEFYMDGDPERSEDCLYLNVWTPEAGNPEAKLPVMLWIHGGAFLNGWGYEIEFGGEAYAQKGVILVTINYRLGMCGFLAHPLLTAENDGKGSGNYGLFDQHAAIDWVYRNIAQFGGDPTNITIHGQSAGAMSVQSQISSPLNEGLVAKAIIQSGGGLRGLASGQKTLEAGEAQGKAMWDAVGCTTLEEMRAWPASKFDEVLAAYYAASGQGGFMGLPYSPIIDGELLCNDTNSVALEAQELQIPYMIGWVAQDLMPGVMESAAIEWCKLQETQGREAYAYCFSRDLPGDEEANEPESFGNMPGAFHSAELWYMFGTLDNCWRPMTEADHLLSEQMVTYWTNFAKTGNPNGEDVPAWEPCTADNPHVQILDIW